MCFGQKIKNTTTTKQKVNIKILARAGNCSRDLSHHSPMCCLLACMPAKLYLAVCPIDGIGLTA